MVSAGMGHLHVAYSNTFMFIVVNCVLLHICIPLKVFCSVFCLQTEGLVVLPYLCVGVNDRLPCSLG